MQVLRPLSASCTRACCIETASTTRQAPCRVWLKKTLRSADPGPDRPTHDLQHPSADQLAVNPLCSLLRSLCLLDIDPDVGVSNSDSPVACVQPILFCASEFGTKWILDWTSACERVDSRYSRHGGNDSRAVPASFGRF